MPRCLALAAVVLSLAPALASAEAEDVVATVRAHDERVAELFEEGDYEAALEELRAAQELLPATPRIFNMALCLQRLGRRQEAVALYRAFEDAADADPDMVEVANQRIEELEAEIAEEARAEEARRAEDAAAPPAAAEETREPRRGISPVPFYATVGVAGALGVAVAVLGGITLSMHEDYADLYPGDDGYEETQDRGRVLALTTDILVGVAGATAVAAVVLAAVADWSGGAGAEGPSVGLAPTPGGAAATLAAPF